MRAISTKTVWSQRTCAPQEPTLFHHSCLHRCQTSGLACNGPVERLSFNKKLPFSPNLRCATTVESSVDRAGNTERCQPITRPFSARRKTPRGNIVRIRAHGYQHSIFVLYLIEQWHLEIAGLHQSTITVPPCSSSPVLANSAMKAKESFDGNRASVHSHATGMRVARIAIKSKISPSKPLLRCHRQRLVILRWLCFQQYLVKWPLAAHEYIGHRMLPGLCLNPVRRKGDVSLSLKETSINTTMSVESVSTIRYHSHMLGYTVPAVHSDEALIPS